MRIGKLGTLAVQPGFCVYVGSAFGPGGLSARITHHRQTTARPHWHMDYLRPDCDLIEVWFSIDTASHEHAGADAVARLPGAEARLQASGRRRRS